MKLFIRYVLATFTVFSTFKKLLAALILPNFITDKLKLINHCLSSLDEMINCGITLRPNHTELMAILIA